jgi:hypothetical protein
VSCEDEAVAWALVLEVIRFGPVGKVSFCFGWQQVKKAADENLIVQPNKMMANVQILCSRDSLMIQQLLNHLLP